MPSTKRPPLTPDAKRALANRVFDKARARGDTIESDPTFVSWVEQWIAGEMEFSDLREKYRQSLQSRSFSEMTATDE